MQPDERGLAKGIRAGDSGAFTDLYDRYAARVMGFALRLTGCRSDAEDLVQDVYLAAYAGRQSYAGRARPLAWLLGIATRRWRDTRRSLAKRPTGLALDEDRVAFADAPHWFEEDALNAITLANALCRLEEPFKEALLLVVSQGLTYKEAAAILQEPVGTTKWRVHEGARRMRAILAESEKSDGVR